MLTFICEMPERSRDKHILWLCRCDCGKEEVFAATRVRNGTPSKCKKCSSKAAGQKIKTHGMRFTPEYRIWMGMKQRCKKGKPRERKSYQDKGISVHPEWENSFQKFYQAIGSRPSVNHSLDRIDNSKGYVPGNVRWATRIEQQRNKDTTVFVTDGFNKFHILDVAAKLGITKGAAHLRLKRGKLHGFTKV